MKHTSNSYGTKFNLRKQNQVLPIVCTRAKNKVSWDALPRSSETAQQFGGECCLHLQFQKQSKQPRIWACSLRTTRLRSEEVSGWVSTSPDDGCAVEVRMARVPVDQNLCGQICIEGAGWRFGVVCLQQYGISVTGTKVGVGSYNKRLCALCPLTGQNTDVTSLYCVRYSHLYSLLHRICRGHFICGCRLQVYKH
jgi:hypothetical protein